MDVWLVAPDVAVIVMAVVPAGVVGLVYEQPASVAAPNAPIDTSIHLGLTLNFLRVAKAKTQAKGMKAKAA